MLSDQDVVIDSVKPISDHGNTYIIYNDAYPNEYYMIENRQKTGWDQSYPAAGMMITHVDFDKDVWENNIPNSILTLEEALQIERTCGNDHQRMTIFHADNDDQTTDFSLQRDPYPYSKRDSLTDNSFPPARLYTPNLAGKKLMGKPITNITRNADLTISFHFYGNNEQTGIRDERLDWWNGERQVIYRMGERTIWTPLDATSHQKNQKFLSH